MALTLEPGLAPETTADAAPCDVVLAATGFDVAEYWRPTAENYLSRITKDQLLDIGMQVFSKAWVEKWTSAKKGEIVKELDRAFADPKKFSGNKETEAKLRAWLPEGMSFTLPEKKAKKKVA